MSLWIIVIIIVIIVVWIVASYNRFIKLIEIIVNNQKQIDVQLDRRFKVFENLINVVKKYMDYEQTTLKDVVALRNNAQKAKESGDDKKRISLENKISKIASGINIVFERYPNLKAIEGAKNLQEEIVNTENKLAYAKQALNDSIMTYNYMKKSFFQQMVISIFKALNKDFEYWNLSPENEKADEDYMVKL